ncbi:TetR/AcrR family transcriptional regulator [Saccharopolyspora cebuensis]|uniref:TetR/AcrR family transcriptional regulator n=1 Tax=Saccharopolyspora cebuensis TaxID=418759 RepID=A0ABV4CMP8_9PSEU
MTSSAATRRRSADRRAQLAAIAAELFCERGYHGVGLGEIAASAGISGPAIYRHFPNKQAILAHAAQDFALALTDCVERAAEHPGDPRERLTAALESVVRLVVRRRGGVRLYQWEYRHLAAEHRTEVRRAIRSLIGAVARSLRQVRPELDDGAAALLASVALSGIASWSTHHAAATDRAAERGLLAVAWTALTTPLPASPPAPASEPVAAGSVAVHASRREKLLAAAVPLLRTRGFHDVRMEEIGAAAGINGSSVYRHFSGKGDLLAAVYYRATERLAALTEHALRDVADPDLAVERLVSAYTAFAFEHRDLAAVYLSEYRNLPTPDRHALRRAQRDHLRRWVALATEVRRDRQAGRTQLAAYAAVNVINDLAMAGTRAAGPEHAAHLALRILRCAD